jgi:hypothetical protein
MSNDETVRPPSTIDTIDAEIDRKIAQRVAAGLLPDDPKVKRYVIAAMMVEIIKENRDHYQKELQTIVSSMKRVQERQAETSRNDQEQKEDGDELEKLNEDHERVSGYIDRFDTQDKRWKTEIVQLLIGEAV